MKKIFEVKTEFYKYGIQCNTQKQAVKWLYNNTNERYIISTNEISESEWDKHHINIDEETRVTLMEVFDRTNTEPTLLYSTDDSFID